MNTFADMDDYIAGFPNEVQVKLEQMRITIAKAAPGATEIISYAMPAFTLNGNLVYFAAYKNHIGFYPTASGIREFKDAIVAYKNSKGAVQFPLDKPLPLSLVTKIVKFRVMENKMKADRKKLNKKSKRSSIK